MDTSNDQINRTRKTFTWVLTAVLWLATVGLGLLAYVYLQGAVFTQMTLFVVQSVNNKQMGITAGGGWRQIAQYAAAFIGGLIWLGVVIAGIEYHFKPKRIGTRKSYQVFAWTLGIEAVILVVSILLGRV